MDVFKNVWVESLTKVSLENRVQDENFLDLNSVNHDFIWIFCFEA